MMVNATAKNNTLHWAWIILAVCFVNLFINYAIRLGYGTILPEMIRTMGITRKDGGQIFNAYFYAYIVFSPFVGYLTDRLGARVVIPAFGLVLGIGILFMGNAQSFWGAAIPFVFVGIGAAAMWTPIITLVQRWFALHRRGMALGILSAGFGLGFAATGKLYPVIVNHWSWRYCWYIFGSAALCMIVINIILLRSKPEDTGRAPWGIREGETQVPSAVIAKQQSCYGEILSAKRFWIIAASYFSIGATLYMITTFMVDYARYELGFPYDKASFLASMHGMGQVVGVLTLPLLSDFLGRKKTISISNLCIAATIVWIVLAKGNINVLYAGIFFFGIFYGSTFPLYGACGGDYFRKEIIGTVIGAFTPFYAFGAITAHWFGGYVRDITGSFFIPFIVAIVLAVISAVLMSVVKKEPGTLVS
ncbi:MAG: MFS transporter [Syntrophorhabdus sp.]